VPAQEDYLHVEGRQESPVFSLGFSLPSASNITMQQRSGNGVEYTGLPRVLEALE